MSDKTVTKIDTLPGLTSSVPTPYRKKRVAAYARVSTDHIDQQTSFAAQVDYYTRLIAEHTEWEFVRVYSDAGISGCKSSNRDGFMQMIADCENGLVDLILTKSLSRFARNTVDSLTTIRKLKALGIGIYFEKENIFTLDSKGEFLISVMSSISQEESRSISENVTWGRRKAFADGKGSIPYSSVLGYDKGEKKFTMVINEEQALVLRKIYRLFLQGYSSTKISEILNEQGINTATGKGTWQSSTIRRMLTNVIYKGDMLLQRQYTVDYLTKKKRTNRGELLQYYIEGDHEGIVSRFVYDYIQEKYAERSKSMSNDNFKKFHGTRLYESKIICKKCGSYFGYRIWHSTTTKDPVWRCRKRFKKGDPCESLHIYDKYLHYLTHCFAIRRIKHDKEITSVLSDCITTVIGRDLSEEIKHILSESVWNMWSDEDDLSLIIQSLSVGDDGTITVKWLDGIEDTITMEYYTPKGKIKESGITMMSEEQKSRIAELRGQGVPFSKIAKQLDLNRDTIKSYCRRYGIGVDADNADKNIPQCKNCGAKIVQPPKKKKKIFCCDKCRNAWWAAHSDKIHKKAMYTHICVHCKKEFDAYGNANRKYCSRECYMAERFGE